MCVCDYMNVDMCVYIHVTVYEDILTFWGQHKI